MLRPSGVQALCSDVRGSRRDAPPPTVTNVMPLQGIFKDRVMPIRGRHIGAMKAYICT